MVQAGIVKVTGMLLVELKYKASPTKDGLDGVAVIERLQFFPGFILSSMQFRVKVGTAVGAVSHFDLRDFKRITRNGQMG